MLEGMPSVDSFIRRVVNTITQYGVKIAKAPIKAWGKDMFGNSKQAKWNLKNERNQCIKDIAEEASMFGYDMSKEWDGNFDQFSKEYHEDE